MRFRCLVTSIALGLVAVPALAQTQQQRPPTEQPLEETLKDVKKENVKLESVPQQARSAIESWAQGGKIKKVEQITGGGLTQYKAHIEKNNKKLEVLVSSTGQVLRSGAEATH